MALTYTSGELESKVRSGEVLHFTNRISPTSASNPEDAQAIVQENKGLLEFLKVKYGNENVFVQKPFDAEREEIFNDHTTLGIYVTMSAFEANPPLVNAA